MLSRSEASLVHEAEILRSPAGSALDDGRANSRYSFINPKARRSSASNFRKYEHP